MYAWYPNNIVEIDFIVYNRYSIHHYEYIFRYIDVYSRFAQAIRKQLICLLLQLLNV